MNSKEFLPCISVQRLSGGEREVTNEDKDYLLSVGDRLRSFMHDQYITIKMLAEWSEIAPNNISNYLNAKNDPSLLKMVRICKALDISLDELCGLKPSGRNSLSNSRKPNRYY